MLRTDSLWIYRYHRLILLLILLFAMVIRLARLNAPGERYFDEVYHAYTAEEWAKGNTDAWLWGRSALPEEQADEWTPPEEDCSYEWTHPPTAKLIMSWSMRVFGIHPWAWRLPGALLGVVCILLIYLTATSLFKLKTIGLLAAAIASLDSLPLFASRIGMNDVYCVTFILTAVLLALRNRYVLSAFAIGLAISCKWTALFGLPLLGLIHLLRVKPRERWEPGRLTNLVLSYSLIVPAMYMGSYIPFFCAGHSVHQFGELQRQMWHYHTTLKATHSYSSRAWEWPIGRGQVWCYVDRVDLPDKSPSTETGNKEAGKNNPRRVVANVYAIGNPIILLAGAAAILLIAVEAVRLRQTNLIIVLAGYLVFWAPWVLSPRIMFLYHYIPPLPFLYIATAWAFISTRISRKGIGFTLIVALIALAAIYPYVTAIYMPEHLTPGHWSWKQTIKD